MNTGAALGQDGSYILASDRLPGDGRGVDLTPASLSIPGLSRMDAARRTLRAGRVYGPVRAGLRRAYIHMAETAAAACCGVGRLRVLLAVLLSLVSFEHFMGVLVFFLLRFCRFPFLRLALGLSKAEKERGDWVFFFVIKNGMSQIPFNAREGEDVPYCQDHMATCPPVRLSCYV